MTSIHPLVSMLTSNTSCLLRNGEHIENPRFFKTALPEVRRAFRSVSRKKLRSKNRKKAVKQLRKKHVRIANLRREHAHKVSNKTSELLTGFPV